MAWLGVCCGRRRRELPSSVDTWGHCPSWSCPSPRTPPPRRAGEGTVPACLCSTRDSWCFAMGRQGGSIHSQLTTLGDGPARPAAHQAGPPGTWGTRHPPRLVWAQEGNVCAGLRLLCGDKDGWPERPRGLRFRLRPAASCCLGSALQSCLIWEMPWRSLGPPSSYARGSCGTQAWTPGGPRHPGSAGHCRKRPSLLPFLFSLLGNPQAGTLWARLIIFKVMETAFLSSAFDNLCGGSGGTWSPL